MTVSAFASVSLVPPLVVVCIDRQASMHALLMRAPHVGISVLAEDQEQLSRLFADGDAEPFETVPVVRGSTGVALLEGAAAHLQCTVEARHDAGDHTLVVARVDDAEVFERAPLLYYRSGYSRLPG